MRAPPLRLLVNELSVLRDWTRVRAVPAAQRVDRVADGQPVMLLPGFLASDLAMVEMKRTLNAAGFATHGWKLGMNRGASPDMLDRLDGRVRELAERYGQPVALVGWSLGGIFAREYAKFHPDVVSRVITMGSPFSGSRRANHAWRLYRLVAGHSVDAPPIALHPANRPSVPTYALWSPYDGVIAPPCAQGMPHERDEAIRVDCVHMSFPFDPVSVNTVIDCLIRPAT